MKMILPFPQLQIIKKVKICIQTPSNNNKYYDKYYDK